jgi:ATP-dependent Lon protease
MAETDSMNAPEHEPEASPAADVTAGGTLPLMAIPGGVVLPEMVVTVALETSESQSAAAAASDDAIVLVPNDNGRFSSIGVLAHIENRATLRNGLPALTIRAISRATIGAGVIGTGDALWVEATPVTSPTSDRTPELAAAYRTVAEDLLEELGGGRVSAALPDTDDAGALADTIAYWPDLSFEQRLQLLETIDVDERLELATSWAHDALQQVSVNRKIHDDVATGMEKDQREVLLRRQLAAIQEELGEASTDVVAEFRSRLDEVAASMPEATVSAVGKEIDRFERVGEQSQEGSWIRTWLDTVFDVPWGTETEDNLDLGAARDVLDGDHTGLDDVKDRIVEHLAVRKLRAERDVPIVDGRRSTAILTLVGPPGVGKTSLGESIASALGRSFVRLALGGVRDEAEIRGHRRTYVGARPGRLVRALEEAGTMNPVIILDEVDKLGADWRGDPSAALLEVLDPAQNHSFRDHYLEFELDLSDVIFIATANRVDTIPGPLLDRVEIIEIDGYTDREKTVIAQRHVLPRLRRQMGVGDEEIVIADGVVAAVAADWTREAGVRGLERKLATLLRKAVTRLATGDVGPITIEVSDLTDLLGKPIPREELEDRTAVPGVATGLAVTGAGGDVLFVEATSMPGEPGLTLTGQLGDVMKESGEIARSYLRAHAEDLEISDVDRRFHVHFPAGAVPKDGPSAGITMTTALASLLTGRRVRPDVAMTGEVTLQGKVLPIGGAKQKLLAAHRAGITDVILPARNGVDLDDVPSDVLEELTIHLVKDVREVLAIALEPVSVEAG